MKLPRFFSSTARHYFMLWRIEKRENARLKVELIEWQNRVLEKANVRPLYKSEPKPVEVAQRAPIGITEKLTAARLRREATNEPTSEQLLEQSENAKRA